MTPAETIDMVAEEAAMRFAHLTFGHNRSEHGDRIHGILDKLRGLFKRSSQSTWRDAESLFERMNANRAASLCKVCHATAQAVQAESCKAMMASAVKLGAIARVLKTTDHGEEPPEGWREEMALIGELFKTMRDHDN
jgi:hypothetical protein